MLARKCWAHLRLYMLQKDDVDLDQQRNSNIAILKGMIFPAPSSVRLAFHKPLAEKCYSRFGLFNL